MATRFATGKKSKAISDVTGFEVRYPQLKTTWNNLRVEPSEFDPKHPQLTPATNVIDATALRSPRPDNDPENVEILIGFTSSITLSRLLRSQQAPVGINTFGRIGHVGISLAEPVTGISGTGAIGTAQAGIGVNGANATGNIGNANPEDEVSVQEQGVAGDGEVGAIALGATSTGVNATGALGEETFDVRTGAITGIAGTGALGSETIGSEPQATGVAGIGNTQPVGQAGGGSFSISSFGVGVAGIAGTGVEVGEANIIESNQTGWNKNEFGYGVWGGDGNIEGISGIGTVSIDIFKGPNPVNSVSGTGTTGTEVPQAITGTITGIAGTGAVGTLSIGNEVSATGVAGTGTTGTEVVSIDGGWSEGAWNVGTWSN